MDATKKKFIILGQVGSGKGTQAKLLAEKFNLTHLSSGQLLRQAAKEDSPQGREIAQLLTSGKLLPLDLNVRLLMPHVEQAFTTGFILDGFPREMPQVEALEQFLQQHSQHIDAVIHLHIPDQVSMERLLKRAKVENRSDDKPAAIQQRLNVYHTLTAPVLEHYRQQGKVIDVDGTPDINTIHQDILTRLAAFHD